MVSCQSEDTNLRWQAPEPMLLTPHNLQKKKKKKDNLKVKEQKEAIHDSYYRIT